MPSPGMANPDAPVHPLHPEVPTTAPASISRAIRPFLQGFEVRPARRRGDEKPDARGDPMVAEHRGGRTEVVELPVGARADRRLLDRPSRDVGDRHVCCRGWVVLRRAAPTTSRRCRGSPGTRRRCRTRCLDTRRRRHRLRLRRSIPSAGMMANFAPSSTPMLVIVIRPWRSRASMADPENSSDRYVAPSARSRRSNSRTRSLANTPRGSAPLQTIADRVGHLEPQLAQHHRGGEVGGPDAGGEQVERTRGTRVRIGTHDHSAGHRIPSSGST